MANLVATVTFSNNVVQLETTDDIMGGPGGLANQQAQVLLNNTAWLKAEHDKGPVFAGYDALSNNPGTFAPSDAGRIKRVFGILDGATSSETQWNLPLYFQFPENASITFINASQRGDVKLALQPFDVTNGISISDYFNSATTLRVPTQSTVTLTKVQGDRWIYALSYRHSALAGEIVLLGYSSPPTGFLLCDGSAISRNDYQRLFLAIGTNFGAGNGSTTFNIPPAVAHPLGAGAKYYIRY